jgi:hypothetical protein
MALAVLRCDGCGGAVLITGPTEAACVQCERAAEVPASHREALAAVRAAQSQIDLATTSWRRFMARSVPSWTYRALAGCGLLAVWAAYGLGLLALHGALTLPVAPRTFVGLVGWLPQLGLTFAWVAAFWYAAPHERAVAVSLQFAATAGEVPGCRQCGAPLAGAGGQPLFVRCLFCGVDNLLGLGEADRRALAAAREQAREQIAATHAAEALRSTAVATGREVAAYVLVPAQLVPLAWALALPDAWQALFGLAVASWAVLFSAMLLAIFTGRDPRTDGSATGAALGLATAALHCVFVGSLG